MNRSSALSFLFVVFFLTNVEGEISTSSAQTPATTSQPSPASAPLGEGASLLPGVSITLYVNSADKEHFEAVVKRALYLRDTDPRVRLAAVFHIGDYRNIAPEIEEALRKRDIYFAGIGFMPKSIGASTSPTWVLRTPTIDHIIEGPIPIEDCLDSQGDYQEPKARQKAVTTSPTPRVKEF